MTFPYKAVFFDWAYTLTDLVEEDDRAAFESMMEFLCQKGINVPNFEVLFYEYRKIFYGMIDESRKTHREACFETVLRHLFFKYKIEFKNRTNWKEVLRVYYNVIHRVRLIYPDVIETLEELRAKGIAMGIISNTTNPEFVKREELARTELDQFFEFALFSSSSPYRKPHPTIFNAALLRLQLQPKDTLFVGDNLIMDIKGPQQVGMSAAWLNRNNSSLMDGIVPDYQITSLKELLTIKTFQV